MATNGKDIFHPSTDLARKVWEKRKELRKFVLENPKSGTTLLRERFEFGKHSELWDEYIFNIVVRPCLEHCCTAPLKEAINKYAKLDQCLFIPYIRREEDPKRFERAFWNVNKYGLRISERINDELGMQTKEMKTDTKKKLCILFKGPLQLAHTEFLVAFLIGCKIFKESVDITVVLLDDNGKSLANITCKCPETSASVTSSDISRDKISCNGKLAM